MTPLFFWRDDLQELHAMLKPGRLLRKESPKGPWMTYDDEIDVALDVKRAFEELRSR